MINIVDRIGKTHNVGQLVYAYFDTLTEKYIVLDKSPEPNTPTVYGTYQEYEQAPGGSAAPNGFIKVEYSTGIDLCLDFIYKDAIVSVINKLKLPVNCTNGAPAIAIKMEKLK